MIEEQEALPPEEDRGISVGRDASGNAFVTGDHKRGEPCLLVLNRTDDDPMSDKPTTSSISSPSPAANTGWASLRVLGLAVVNIVVVAAFVGLFVGGIWLFCNGYPWLVSISAVLLFMIVALFTGATWRDRIAMCCRVPSMVLGAYIGFKVYFAMFHFAWFDAVFNDKGIFQVGLIVFALGTGFAVAWCTNRLFFVLWPVGATQENARQSEETE